MAADSELGEFLRARRARLRPGDVGLPAGTAQRRTPGLRREELAALAGLSIDYYIRLEQGKETNPSGSILDGLARALKLNDEEHGHLYALANHTAGRTAPSSGRASRVVRPGISWLLENLRPCPAYLLSRTSDILDANPEALALIAGIGDWPPERRNTVRYHFLHPAAKNLYANWDADAVSTAAHLRSLQAAHPGDPDLAALTGELIARSPEFARLWRLHDVRHRRGAEKTFRHPLVGDLTLNYEVLNLDDSQRVTVYQAAPGSRDHDAMILLAMTASDDQAPQRPGRTEN